MKILFNFFLLVTFMKTYPALAENPEIAVIGAGLAGLSAAHRIEKLTGYPVQVYEARSRPGGRVYTVYLGNSYEELGAKVLNDGGEEATNIRSLIAEMGLETVAYDVGIARREFIYNDEIVSYYDAYKNGPIPDEQAYLALKEKAKSVKNLKELLDPYFAGHEVMRHITELRMRGWEGNDTADLAPFYLDSFWGFYEHKYEISQHQTNVPSYRIDYVKGGNSTLIYKLADSLKKPISYNQPLRKIAHGDNGKILLQFDQGQAQADYIVLAMPCSTLKDVEIERGLIPEDQVFAINNLQYGTNCKILVPVGMKDKEAPVFSITSEGVTWFSADMEILTIYFGGSAGDIPSDQISQKIASEIPALKKLYPQLQLGANLSPAVLQGKPFARYFQPVGISWIQEEFSKGSYSSWGEGLFDIYQDKETFFGETVRKVFRPVNGKVFFAGEHTSLLAPATMEGAVESGERAGRMVTAAIKS